MASTISRQGVVLDPGSTVFRILLVVAGCSSPSGSILPSATGQIGPSEAGWLSKLGSVPQSPQHPRPAKWVSRHVRVISRAVQVPVTQYLSQEISARQEGWGGWFTSIAPNEPCDSGSVTEKPASMAGSFT